MEILGADHLCGPFARMRRRIVDSDEGIDLVSHLRGQPNEDTELDLHLIGHEAWVGVKCVYIWRCHASRCFVLGARAHDTEV